MPSFGNFYYSQVFFPWTLDSKRPLWKNSTYLPNFNLRNRKSLIILQSQMIDAFIFISDAEDTAIRPRNAIIRLIERLIYTKFFITKANTSIFPASYCSLLLARGFKFFKVSTTKVEENCSFVTYVNWVFWWTPWGSCETSYARTVQNL